MRLVVVGLMVVAVACGPPITVRRVSPRTVTADLTKSALNAGVPSVPTQNTLYRWNLTDRFENDPEGAIAALHDLVVSGKAGPAHGRTSRPWHLNMTRPPLGPQT